MTRARENTICLAIAFAFGGAFWLPAIGAARGYFPAPLDDVYIHFDFARSLAQGHPFQWIAGQGYSSGETSPLYAVVLAVGYVVGFRARALGLWAAIVAVLAVASLVRSTARLAGGRWLLALVPLSIGLVDWTLFSGMEVAVFAAVLGRSLETLARLRGHRRGATREALQWRLGGWGAALVLLRPEAVVIVAVFALAAARGVARRSALLAMLRVGLFGAAATLGVLGANYLGTGDARSAGAQLKLLSSNPYLSEVDRARVFVENLVALAVKVFLGELAYRPVLALALPLLAFVAVVRRSSRAIAATCLVAALGWTLLVSWNGNAPYHNFRYYVPALLLLAIASALGLAAIARRRLRSVLGVGVLAIGGAKIPDQVRHFRTACANIRDQHIEVAERLGRLPEPARVLLGDAGAIPYVSGLPAVDALGLGGYRRMPFAHAAVFGEAATIELIERLEPAARPTHFALYANWFGALTSRFGVEIDRVTITDNVICGSPTKVIYRADWRTLDEPPRNDVIDVLDVGDVIDEEAHHYAPPLPHGGWTTLDVLEDVSKVRRFDGGRTIPDGAVESFVVQRGGDRLTLRVRVDAGARAILVRTPWDTRELTLDPVREGAWREGWAVLEHITVGDTIRLEARGEYRDYHLWLTR